jgi:hypothetical protein
MHILPLQITTHSTPVNLLPPTTATSADLSGAIPVVYLLNRMKSIRRNNNIKYTISLVVKYTNRNIIFNIVAFDGYPSSYLTSAA